jgi:hypothetical protein
MMSIFTARTFYPDQDRVEASEYDLVPTHEQAQAICDLFLNFLSEQPLEFRKQLPFINNANIELEWAAAEGGAALASFYADDEPLSMAILLAGIQPESDSRMLEGLRQAVLEPVLGDQAAKHLDAAERPLLFHLIFPGRPEYAPRAQILATALASVFFRAVLTIHAQMAGGEQQEG